MAKRRKASRGNTRTAKRKINLAKFFGILIRELAMAAGATDRKG